MTDYEEGSEEDSDLRIKLSRDATFADLYKALDELEEERELGDFHFDEELWDNFTDELASEVLSFRNNPIAETTQVLEYFKQHGCGEEHVKTYLPIDFV